MVTDKQLAEWLSRIVQIPSVSPDYADPKSDIAGEARLASQLAQWFGDFGAEVHTHEVLPNRPNVYGIWRGRTDRWIGLDIHMDTVGVTQMPDDPFSGRIADGRVYGRGAVDTKASLGVVLALLETMHKAGKTPEPNLLLAAVVDEESGMRGAFACAEWIRAQGLSVDQFLVAEPTLCIPVHGHKGIVRLEFHVKGKASHTSQPHLGQNAVVAAAPLVLALDEEHQRLVARPPQTELGTGTLAVSMIQGGRGTNVVPDLCTISIDRRVVAEEEPTEITAMLRELAGRVCPLPVEVDVIRERKAVFQPADTRWLRQLAEWSGNAPTVAPYGTDAWAYTDLARECVVLGPGSIDQAHGAEEWVEISELEKLAGIYRRWWGIGS